MVQLILNSAYLPITDVSEIGLFGEILSDESVGVFIQPFLPRMVGAAKISLRFQCFGYFGVLVELFAIVHGDGVHSGFMCWKQSPRCITIAIPCSGENLYFSFFKKYLDIQDF